MSADVPIQFTTTLLNLRAGDFQTDDGRTLDWAHLHFLNTEVEKDGFLGCEIAKMRVTPENNNRLFNQLQKSLRGKFPCRAAITAKMDIKQGKAELTAIDVQCIE